jgi:hypothetical protein
VPPALPCRLLTSFAGSVVLPVRSGRCAELRGLEKIGMEFVDRTRQLAHFAARSARPGRFLDSLKPEGKVQAHATREAMRP